MAKWLSPATERSFWQGLARGQCARRIHPSVPGKRLDKIWGVHHPFRLFAALRKHWRELTSCTAFTILGIYAVNKEIVWLAEGSAYLALAALFFRVATYHAWRQEHDKYTGDVAKYQRPDISGEAFNFTGYRIRADDQSRSHWGSSHEVTFEVFSCNHSPINTTLKCHTRSCLASRSVLAELVYANARYTGRPSPSHHRWDAAHPNEVGKDEGTERRKRTR